MLITFFQISIELSIFVVLKFNLSGIEVSLNERNPSIPVIDLSIISSRVWKQMGTYLQPFQLLPPYKPK